MSQKNKILNVMKLNQGLRNFWKTGLDIKDWLT